MVGGIRVFRGIETVRRAGATDHGEFEGHRGVTVRNVGLSKAGQIPLHPTEGVVQREGRSGNFTGGTRRCRRPNDA